MKTQTVLFFVVFVAVFTSVTLLLQRSEDANVSDDEQIACTADAKECPDGSYVGREAPNCEFAACPGE